MVASRCHVVLAEDEVHGGLPVALFRENRKSLTIIPIVGRYQLSVPRYSVICSAMCVPAVARSGVATIGAGSGRVDLLKLMPKLKVCGV